MATQAAFTRWASTRTTELQTRLGETARVSISMEKGGVVAYRIKCLAGCDLGRPRAFHTYQPRGDNSQRAALRRWHQHVESFPGSHGATA